MKAGDALKLAGIAFAGVAAFLVVSRTMKAGGRVVEAATQVVTKDLNPASPENVVYRNLPETVQEKVGNFLGSIFDPAGYARYKANLAALASQPAAVQTQRTTATPEQIENEKTLLRKMERSYTDPFPESVPRQDRYAAPADFPINF